MQEICEWVVRVGKKDFYLTDKQHELLIKAREEGLKMLVFKDLTINPSFVEYTFRQKVAKTGNLCDVCTGSGIMVTKIVGNTATTETCPSCKGLGRI